MSSKRKFAPGQESGYIGESKRKALPRKELIVSPAVAQYLIDRDNDMLGDIWVCEETKELIRLKYESNTK